MSEFDKIAGDASARQEEDSHGSRRHANDVWFMDTGCRNPYENSEAIRKFLELYTGKQRKNPKLWLDYFTSDAFLDAGWDIQFAELLLDKIEELEKDYPVNREFLTWLCAAYQFLVIRKVYANEDGSERTEFEFRIRTEAQFEGQNFIFKIAAKGPSPRQLKGNEHAVSESFWEYRQLVSMAGRGSWEDRDLDACSQILSRYVSGYITDKCRQQGDMDYERHPAGLRLITHFFSRPDLPDELYRIAWQKLDLKTAVMGRSKILYGSLRELALKRLPELSEKERESFTALREAFHIYAVSTYKSAERDAGATDEEIQKTDELFAREDFRRALMDRRFVEEEMLHTWVTEARCSYYLEKIIEFYREHENAPCAGPVAERAKIMLQIQKNAARLRADRADVPCKESVTLENGAFFRHWINTGFYQARDRESGQWLMAYLNEELSYLPEWSRRFLEVEEDEIDPQTVSFDLGGDRVEIRFHLRYQEFLINGNPVFRPCIAWERVAGLTDRNMFFFLLPIAVADRDMYETVKKEISCRLADTAAPERDGGFIAACLADRVCQLAEEEDGQDEDWQPCRWTPESALPFEMYRENPDHLYVCSWAEREHTLYLYEQLQTGRYLQKDGTVEEVLDAASAADLADWLLEEKVRPPRIPMEKLVNLPDAVYAMPDFQAVCNEKDVAMEWKSPMERLGEDVTAGLLETLVTRFADGKVARLELSWKCAFPMGAEQDYEPRRSLVFLKDGQLYACLYFDDFRAKSYALLARPELYGKLKEPTRFVRFRQGRLFSNSVHPRTSGILRNLDKIFGQVSWPNNVNVGGIWNYAVNVAHGRHKYNLDKQLLGGFPMERAYNRQDAPFYFSLYPDSAVGLNGQGEEETFIIGEKGRGFAQTIMARFVKGDFLRLKLTWGKTEGKRQHVVMFREDGRFLFAWVSEEKQTVEYHVADKRTYMDVEGKKYPKTTFQGRIVPAYLVHEGVLPFKNALELLLACVDDPERITGQFAEYAWEKPGRKAAFSDPFDV